MKLSVVIAAYDMQRELPRTLETVFPPIQRCVDANEYEVLVIDNGSPTPMDIAMVEPHGVRHKLIRIEPGHAKPSPVFCINEVVAREADGDAVLICIDGARMFSPFIIRRTIDLLAKFPHAATFVGSRHLGPKKQMQSVKEGYSAAVEDALLETIDWRGDSDLLYNASVWASAHKENRFAPQNESNALGMRIEVWNRLGGYNEKFARPGGGLCNLELFNRIINRPSALNVLLYGESTFHQVHGGAATSHDGYFSDSLQEHAAATGEDYAFPPPNFLVDLGLVYGRMEKLSAFYNV